MKHFYSQKRLFAVFASSLLLHSCMNSDYDLGELSLKMTLGPNGITLPLGKDTLSASELINDGDIEDLVVDDGFYAYNLRESIQEQIDAIAIDPISDVIPDIEPHQFNFAKGSLPESFTVKGHSSSATINMPDFDFGDESLDGVSIQKQIGINNLIGQTVPSGQEFPLPELNEDDSFGFTLNNVPTEIAAVNNLYFAGAPAGTPIRVSFTLGTIASAAQSGRMSLTLTMPSPYTLKLQDNYSGHASVSGNALTLTNYPVTGDRVEFEFYLAERTVTEQISVGRTLSIDDQLTYSFNYTGISNGQQIVAGSAPVFSLSIAPSIDDAAVQTNAVIPTPETSTSDMTFQIDGMSGISEVDYIAFSDDASNAITLSASQPQLPLRGDVDIQITFPDFLNFKSGISSMMGNTLHTTLDQLAAGNIVLPLEGTRFSNGEGRVSDEGVLAVSRPITVVVSPNFPGDSYRLSELKTTQQPDIDILIRDMVLHLDLSESIVKAGFSEPINITQQIDNSFDVPAEVGEIYYASVINDATLNSAYIDILLEIADSPVDELYIDNINIELPTFLDASHPKLNTETNTIHIDRIIYKDRPVSVAQIKLEGIRDIPVATSPNGKTAQLSGLIRLQATANIPDDSVIDGIENTQVTILPKVSMPPLRIEDVLGKMDIDIAQYLKPTTIDLGDLGESLGNQDVELNLVAPRISLTIENPMGAAMIGDIVLQPYDMKGNKLDQITVKDISIEPASGVDATQTKLFISDLSHAPEGYKLCRVEDLSKLVKVIPSKIDVAFNLKLDENRDQRIALTGEPYAFNVNYWINLPLRFREDASIAYAGTTDVSDAFSDVQNYNITAEDVAINLHASTTLPLDMSVTIECLNQQDEPIDNVQALVVGSIKGYNSASDGEYKESDMQVQLKFKDNGINQLQHISKLRYSIDGKAVGSQAGLAPDQYVSLTMKLILKKGITFDISEIASEK